MGSRKFLRKLLLELLVPLGLVVLGTGGGVVGRLLGSDLLLWGGIALVLVGLVWIFLSCLKDGINPFDL